MQLLGKSQEFHIPIQGKYFILIFDIFYQFVPFAPFRFFITVSGIYKKKNNWHAFLVCYRSEMPQDKKYSAEI